MEQAAREETASGRALDQEDGVINDVADFLLWLAAGVIAWDILKVAFRWMVG
jgi:hypothetical protein